MNERCQQPQAHPERCGCAPAGTEQVSSAWLAQLRAEYRQFGDEVARMRLVVVEKDAEIARLNHALEVKEEFYQDALHSHIVLVKQRDEVTRDFKAFHAMLCSRFDYAHDDQDWQRDQISLMEFIAAKANAQPARQVGGDEQEAFERAYAEYARVDLAEIRAAWDGDLYGDQGMRDALFGWQARASLAPVATIPELNRDLVAILGRPNFTCNHLAQLLRLDGREIPRKSEEEQAAVIHWLLGLYLQHGEVWWEKGAEEVQRIRAAIAQQQEGGEDRG